MLPPTGHELVVRAALLPDANGAIDATLGVLHPLEEDDGFACIAYLADAEEPQKSIVRKVLAAGAAIGLVRLDDRDDEAYQVHGDFYHLLARLRLGVPQPILEVGFKNGPDNIEPNPTIILAPTEDELIRALKDLSNDDRTDFVILRRKDGDYADFIQSAGFRKDDGSLRFILEWRIWLDEEFFEHYRMSDNYDDKGFSNIKDIEKAMLHWLKTDRLPPEFCIVKNVTAEHPPFKDWTG